MENAYKNVLAPKIAKMTKKCVTNIILLRNHNDFVPKAETSM